MSRAPGAPDFDNTLLTPDGNAFLIENAVCLHEEDYGILSLSRVEASGNLVTAYSLLPQAFWLP